MGSELLHQSKVMVSCAGTYHGSFGHASHATFAPVPMAPQCVQSLRDWAQTFGAAVRQRSVRHARDHDGMSWNPAFLPLPERGATG